MVCRVFLTVPLLALGDDLFQSLGDTDSMIVTHEYISDWLHVNPANTALASPAVTMSHACLSPDNV